MLEKAVQSCEGDYAFWSGNYQHKETYTDYNGNKCTENDDAVYVYKLKQTESHAFSGYMTQSGLNSPYKSLKITATTFNDNVTIKSANREQTGQIHSNAAITAPSESFPNGDDFFDTAYNFMGCAKI